MALSSRLLVDFYFTVIDHFTAHHRENHLPLLVFTLAASIPACLPTKFGGLSERML
jgi:hypothetical protein